MQVGSELGDELRGEIGVGDLVDAADDFRGMPSGAHFAVGVSGPEQACQILLAPFVEPFLWFGE